jgi:hypothetical protein
MLDARTMHLARRAIDNPNTGMIEGHARVLDEPLVGVTIIVVPTARPPIDPTLTLPELIATPETPRDGLVRESDDNGNYVVDDLQPGSYDVALYYGDLATTVSNVDVVAGFATRVDLIVSSVPVRGETVRTVFRSTLDDGRLAN